MKAILGEITFNVVELKGHEEMLFGFSFEVVLVGNYDLNKFPIGEIINIEIWRGRIVFWSQEWQEIHSKWFFRCNFISSFQYFCNSKKYNIYKNLDYKSIISEILTSNNLESNFSCNSAKKYPQIVQYNDSDHDFVKYLCSKNNVYMYLNSKNDLVVISDVLKGENTQLNLFLESIELNLKASNIKVFSNKDNFTSSLFFNYFKTKNEQKIFQMSSSGVISSLTTYNKDISIGYMINFLGKSYFVLQIKHFFDLSGYKNELILVEKGSEKVPDFDLPDIPGPQTATVVAHEKASIAAIFPWSNEKSLQMLVSQLFASENHGAFFMPEYGDAILVYFETGTRINAFVQGAIYTDKNRSIYDLHQIKSFKVKSNYDNSKHIEFLIDPNDELMKLTSFGDLREEIAREKSIKIQNGSFFLQIADNSIIKIDQNDLIVNMPHEIIVQTSDVKIKTSKISIFFEELELSGSKIKIASNAVLIDTKGFVIQAPEFKIKSSKIEIS